MKKLTTLNPVVSFGLAALSLVGIIIVSFFDSLAVSVFALGIAVTFPIAKKMWVVIEKNWGIYKKFYKAKTFEKRFEAAKKSWQLTWWIVPYCLSVYSFLSILIIFYSGSIYLLYSLILGAIFTDFYISYQKSEKYYKQIK